jgi:hypothetical protein
MADGWDFWRVSAQAVHTSGKGTGANSSRATQALIY